MDRKHPAARGPLAGLTVVDLSTVVSGPMATALLADQGAEVIKVESAAGDLTRKIGPVKGDTTGLFAAVNRGKRSIVLDPRQPEGLVALRQLIARADLLVENFRPGVMERLGLGWETLHAQHPRLVMLSITGFGSSGPYAGQRVYDTVIQAVSGMADAHPDEQTGEPHLLRTLMCDKVTALTAAQAATAALLARAGDGRGRHVEVNMLDAAVAFLWPEAFYNHAFLDEPPAPVPEYGSTLALWRASDGYFSLVTPQDDEFAAMCRAFGHPEWTADPRLATIPLRRRHYQLVRDWAEPIVATRTVAHWLERLAAEGAPAGRVNTKAELHLDPQVLHNGTLQAVDHGELGRIRMPRAAARFDGQAAPPLRPAPRLGELQPGQLDQLLPGSAAGQG
ncbi:MAG: hypothetical protein RIQ60_4415 [Pseudomonadota bacterium]|jgi:crotonobetainyl-CoA:carnitine CoA-transferase CaiB-like acyl-CoA transferase